MALMFQPLWKYATFSGRARRTEYWLFVLFVSVVGLVTIGIDALLFGLEEVGRVNLVWNLAMFLPMLAVGARRLHDTDRSGWWQLLNLAPIVGWIVLVVLFCLRGEKGTNRFGPDPLDPRAQRAEPVRRPTRVRW